MAPSFVRAVHACHDPACRWYHRRGKRRAAMPIPDLPPLISSDGHLEVRPERWSPRMPAKHRAHAPRTIKLADGRDAIQIEGQPPYPAPFLDLRAGRTNETWEPLGVTVDDTAGLGRPGQRAPAAEGAGVPAGVVLRRMTEG